MGFSIQGKLDLALDIAGAYTLESNRTLADESAGLGKALAGQTGAAASIVAGAAAGLARVTGLTGMVAASRHRFLTITGATSGANNGTWLIAQYNSATSVDVVNAAAVIPDANNGAIGWTERNPFSAEDHVNFTLTDRAAIKGVAYDAAIPTYQRPTAVGTSVPANLSNVAGKTLDAFAQVVDVRFVDRKLRPSISQAGTGNVLIADETFTTDDFHFTAADLNSFITLTDGTATGATGTYRIKAVTDGKTLELDGLAATGAGTADWVLESDVKAILSSAGHADAVDRTGIPLADTGAEDQTVYAATFADLINPISNGGAVTEAGLRIWARTFGDQADPNSTTAAEGTRFYEQLYTGVNDGTATVSLLESISGRSGSAASVTNATNNVTGLSGMSLEDVGRYLTLYGTAVDGNQRHAKITAFISASSVTVDGAAFATDANDGAILWKVSRHPGNWDVYAPLRQRSDQVSETAGRGMLIGGIVSDAELTQDVLEIRNAVGISDGVSSLAGLLTNTGVYYAFNNLPDALPSVVEALNTLNAQIGDRNYTGAILADGQTITASLQALSTAIAASSTTRVIERLAADVNANTAHSLPGGNTYTVDGTNNGLYMDVFWRKALRDPGPASTPSNDYEETSTTQITPYEKIKAGDSINYLIRA